jgi:hypothetical protein
MKKLLVLALVLSMATLANAALQISVNGDTQVTEITLMPSDVVTLDIATDAIMGFGIGDWYGAALVVAPLATIDASQAVSMYAATEPGIAIFQSAAVDLGYPVPEGLAGPGFTFTFTGANINPGTIIDLMTLHCNGPGDVVIQLLGSQDYIENTVLATLIVHQLIPEPITMGLLGLGGLFLRRRK